MIQNLPNKVEELTQYINDSLIKKTNGIDFANMNKNHIDQLIEIEEHINILQNCFMLKRDTINDLESYFVFIDNHEKYLPSIKTELKNEIKKSYKLYGKILKNVVYVNDTISND